MDLYTDDGIRRFSVHEYFEDTPESQKEYRLKVLKGIKEEVKNICKWSERIASQIGTGNDREIYKLAFDSFSASRRVYEWIQKEERNCKRRKA